MPPSSPWFVPPTAFGFASPSRLGFGFCRAWVRFVGASWLRFLPSLGSFRRRVLGSFRRRCLSCRFSLDGFDFWRARFRFLPSLGSLRSRVLASVSAELGFVSLARLGIGFCRAWVRFAAASWHRFLPSLGSFRRGVLALPRSHVDPPPSSRAPARLALTIDKGSMSDGFVNWMCVMSTCLVRWAWCKSGYRGGWRRWERARRRRIAPRRDCARHLPSVRSAKQQQR